MRSIAVELRDYLVHARASADEEIRTYPTPIPCCDAQFNFVYDQRSRLTEFINILNAALDREDPESTLESVLAEFIASSPLSDGIEERDLRARLAAVILRSSFATTSTPG
jgi:hypothetical protein